jgi:hypothetical protein
LFNPVHDAKFATIILFIFQMADHFCNSVGILQQYSPPSQFAGFEKQKQSPSEPPQEG